MGEHTQTFFQDSGQVTDSKVTLATIADLFMAEYGVKLCEVWDFTPNQFQQLSDAIVKRHKMLAYEQIMVVRLALGGKESDLRKFLGEDGTKNSVENEPHLPGMNYEEE